MKDLGLSGSFTRRIAVSFFCVLFGFGCVGRGSAVEQIRIDLQDNYFEGEPLQVRLILPEKLGDTFLLLLGPEADVETILPNAFESVSAETAVSGKRLFPDPSLGYQAVLGGPGNYRLLTVNVESLPRKPEWPDSVPSDLIGTIRSLNRALKEAGCLTEAAYSTVAFTVRAGQRPAEETLPLVEGTLDGPGNPVFASGSTRLATSQDYRKLWRWAKLMNSPAHRHQSFLIECHAKGEKTRTRNLELSQQRADAIAAYLVEECRVAHERLTSVGRGNFEPLDEIESDDRRQNRVTLVLDNVAGARILR